MYYALINEKITTNYMVSSNKIYKYGNILKLIQFQHFFKVRLGHLLDASRYCFQFCFRRVRCLSYFGKDFNHRVSIFSYREFHGITYRLIKFSRGTDYRKMVRSELHTRTNDPRGSRIIMEAS